MSGSPEIKIELVDRTAPWDMTDEEMRGEVCLISCISTTRVGRIRLRHILRLAGSHRNHGI